MEEKYYTVEQISQMLGMHPKTVQRYIREGKLRAGKIGKSWRVSGHDLSVFTERAENIPPQNGAPSGAERVKVSAVADIAVPGREEAVRIMNMLTAALNAKPPEYGPTSMHTQYIQAEDKVRVTLWGGSRFMEAMLGAISALTEQTDAEEKEELSP